MRKDKITEKCERKRAKLDHLCAVYEVYEKGSLNGRGECFKLFKNIFKVQSQDKHQEHQMERSGMIFLFLFFDFSISPMATDRPSSINNQPPVSSPLSKIAPSSNGISLASPLSGLANGISPMNGGIPSAPPASFLGQHNGVDVNSVLAQILASGGTGNLLPPGFFAGLSATTASPTSTTANLINSIPMMTTAQVLQVQNSFFYTRPTYIPYL